MEKTTPLGLLGGLALIGGAVALGGGGVLFLDPTAALIVVGGTAAGLAVAFPTSDLRRVPRLLRGVLAARPPALGPLAATLADVCWTARRDGPLALEARRTNDPALRAALELAADGVSEAHAERILRARLAEATAGLSLVVRLFHRAATLAPAFGLAGTLVGLVQMLQSLHDPATLGPAMAVALVATFYGVLLTNLVFLPLAGKAQGQIAAQARVHEMIRVATLGVLRAEAPGLVAQHLHLLAGEAPPIARRSPTTLRRAV